MIRQMVRFQVMKIDRKCKHLLHLPEVLLDTLLVYISDMSQCNSVKRQAIELNNKGSITGTGLGAKPASRTTDIKRYFHSRQSSCSMKLMTHLHLMHKSWIHCTLPMWPLYVFMVTYLRAGITLLCFQSNHILCNFSSNFFKKILMFSILSFTAYSATLFCLHVLCRTQI
jgi:hypothetical protein